MKSQKGRFTANIKHSKIMVYEEKILTPFLNQEEETPTEEPPKEGGEEGGEEKPAEGE